jgi:hypothetical protein
MRRIHGLVLLGLMAAGCRAGGDDFSDATPDVDSLTLEVTGDPAQEGLDPGSAGETAQALGPSAPGGVPEYLHHARSAVRTINEAIASFVRPIVAMVAAGGPRAQVGDTRTFGPRDRGSATFRLIVKKNAPRLFSWVLQAKPKGADDAQYVNVAGGAIEPGLEPHRGRGVLGADLDKLAQVDSAFKGSGQLLAGFAHVAGFKVLNWGLHNFSPDVTAHDPVDAIFSGWRGPLGGTRVRMAVHANIADSPTDARELVLLRARWLPGEGGRADAIAIRGDVPDGHAIVANSCWDRNLDGSVNGFLLVRDCTPGRLSCTVIRTEGRPANCARGLENEELPPELPTDPTLEPGAPEQPAIPSSMPGMPAN